MDNQTTHIEKRALVEYMIYRLHQEDVGFFSVLKFLKLLFLIAGVETTHKVADTLMDEFFSFKAYPYGPTEEEVLHMLRDDHLKYYTHKGGRRLVVKKEYEHNLPSELMVEVDRKINLLPKHLFKYSAFKLVDLTRQYYSWQLAYHKAQQQDKSSYPMLNSIIKNEVRLYNL